MAASKYKNMTIGMRNGDIDISAGRFIMVYGKDSYLIQIETAVKTLLGEILLNPNVGIDYFGTVFENADGFGPYVWEKNVRDLVLSFPFVIGIESFTYGIDHNHILSYRLVVETDDGLVETVGGMSPSSAANDADIPTMLTPLTGKTFPLDTDEELAAATQAIVGGIEISPTSTATLEDQYKATKKIIKSLGGNTIDDVGEVEYNSDQPPFKPLEGSTLPLENDEDVHDDTKTIIQILGGEVE